METLEIVVHGLIQCVVATNITDNVKRIEELTNQVNPTGISSKWKFVKCLGPSPQKQDFFLYQMEC